MTSISIKSEIKEERRWSVAEDASLGKANVAQGSASSRRRTRTPWGRSPALGGPWCSSAGVAVNTGF